jgi:SAM-dependent methyltransferase
MRPNPPGNRKGWTPPDKFFLCKEDKAHGLQFQGKRDEEGKEVGVGFWSREEAREFVERCGPGPYRLQFRVREQDTLAGMVVVPDDLHLSIEGLQLPFEDGAIGEIHCYDVLQYVRDIESFMQECCRVLPPQGVLHISVPLKSADKAWADPKICRWFVPATFDYFSGFSFKTVKTVNGEEISATFRK